MESSRRSRSIPTDAVRVRAWRSGDGRSHESESESESERRERTAREEEEASDENPPKRKTTLSKISETVLEKMNENPRMIPENDTLASASERVSE